MKVGRFLLLLVVVGLGVLLFVIQLATGQTPLVTTPAVTLTVAITQATPGPILPAVTAHQTAAASPSALAPTATPLSPSPTATPIPWQKHLVQSGETLTSIATLYHLTVEQLQAVNYLTENDLLFAGQWLIIPPQDSRGAMLWERPTPYTVVVIGRSVQNRPIYRFTFGEGPVHLVFVGAIHGGYEWNSALLAYQAIDYFAVFPQDVPANITLHIIPTANPDGLFLATGKEGRFTAADIPPGDALNLLPGRFNANEVDLNRNWDCRWSAQAFFRDQVISGGSAAFSERETQVLRDFLTQPQIQGVVFWHSAAATVIPGGCEESHPPSLELAEVYRAAANYPNNTSLGYPITGDASDYLAQQGIPAITVELTNHEDTDGGQNMNGMLAVLQWAGNQQQ